MGRAGMAREAERRARMLSSTTAVPRTISSGSTSTGSYPSLYLVTICGTGMSDAGVVVSGGKRRKGASLAAQTHALPGAWCQQRRPRGKMSSHAGSAAPTGSRPQAHLEATRALRQVRVSVHPVQAVHVYRHPAGSTMVSGGACHHHQPQHVGQGAQQGRAARPAPCCGRHLRAMQSPAGHSLSPRLTPQLPACQRSPTAHLLSVSFDLRLQAKPISFSMSMPCLAARVSAGQREEKDRVTRQSTWRRQRQLAGGLAASGPACRRNSWLPIPPAPPMKGQSKKSPL